MVVNTNDEPGDTGTSDDGGESGDTGGGTSTSNGGGDTPSGESGESGDTDELEQLRATVAEMSETVQKLQREKDDLTKDRDKGIRKRKTLEQRVAELETSRKADLEKIAQSEHRERVNGTRGAILGELHSDHQSSKTAKRVVDALQGEGLDFSAEERTPVVDKAVEILKKDNPEFFEKRKQERMPVLAKTKNGKVESEGKGGIRNAKGEQLF